MKNVPNFAAWNLDTLAKFAEDAYVRMQEQEMALEQAQRDLKDAMVQLRKAMWEAAK
jgi:hypothetical protein